MSDEPIRLVTVGRIVRRRWRLLILLTVVGALVGYGTSVLFPPRYTASASVLLPGQWEERELLTQVGVATSSAVVGRAGAALGWDGVSGDELLERVSAEASDGNIIKVSGTAGTPERAQRLADQVAQQFVTFAARIAGGGTGPGVAAETEALREKLAQTHRRITDLADAADPGRTVESVQARTELAKLRTELQQAVKKLEQADRATGKPGMVVMGPAARPAGESPPTRTHLIAAGALLFFLVTVIGHLAAARTSRRLRTGPEIAAALGSTLLGTVDVPEEPRGAHGRDDGGARARIRRLLGVDTRWDLPAPQRTGGEGDGRVGYRRVCARLRDQLPAAGRLLVVVADGDEIARRAAGQLITEAGKSPSPGSPSAEYPVPRVVEVSVDRPMVPDGGAESGALVVLSAGSRTAEELSGIAGACADGGHEVVGVVVAGTVRTRATRTAGRSEDTATVAPAGLGPVTGGSL